MHEKVIGRAVLGTLLASGLLTCSVLLGSQAPDAAGDAAGGAQSGDARRAPGAQLSLPRIPWEGGPRYWKRFDNAVEWTDPAFFPIGVWFGAPSTDTEVAWDVRHGINFYAGAWEGTDFELFERGGTYWVGGALNETFDDASPHWPGVFLDDEVDGRFAPDDGIALLSDAHARVSPRQFSYANYTQMVIGPDLEVAAQEAYVNLPSVVSLDMYWYTIPFCDWEDYRGLQYAEPVPEASCRTASSYGRAMNALTLRDAADGELHPRWMFIENLNGLSGQEHVAYMTPGQVQGAAMSSVINEARGLLWFNQSLTGPCQSGGALRAAQMEGDEFCGSRQIAAMGQVNALIHGLAPVLNTQSYEWEFGPGLDTMLKAVDGYAYVFAMTDGSRGPRTLQLPPDLARSTSVEVWQEEREIAVSNGRFTDEFASEHEFHIYRVSLDRGTT